MYWISLPNSGTKQPIGFVLSPSHNYTLMYWFPVLFAFQFQGCAGFWLSGYICWRCGPPDWPMWLVTMEIINTLELHTQVFIYSKFWRSHSRKTTDSCHIISPFTSETCNHIRMSVIFVIANEKATVRVSGVCSFNKPLVCISMVLPVASVFYSVMQKVPCILVDCSPVEAVDWKGLLTFTGGETEVGYELEGKWKETERKRWRK